MISPADTGAPAPRPEPGSTAQARRVLVVSPQPFYEDRGTPIAVRQVLHALSELGYRVDLLTYPIGTSPEIAGVRYFRAANPLGFRSVPVGFSLRKLVLDVALVGKLIRQVRRERYDAIHALEEGAFPAALVARWKGIPLVYDMQSSLPEQLTNHRVLGARPLQSILRACEQWLLRRADQVVGSAGLAAKVRGIAPGTPMREWAFHAEPRAALSEQGAAEVWRTLGVEPGKRVVLYTGTFAEYQGMDLLLDAARAVCAARRDVSFVLVGGYAAEQGEARSGVARLGMEGRVHVLGRLPRERTLDLIRAADVLVSPRSYGGNLPLKIFDYLAAGRAIVATDIETHRTVLDDRCAVLVRAEAADLAAGIGRLLDDAALRADLGAAARVVAAERFGWPGFVRTVAALYSDVFRSAVLPLPTAARGGAGAQASAGRPGARGEPALTLAPPPSSAAQADSPLASGTTGY